jgi:hypothetical protein
MELSNWSTAQVGQGKYSRVCRVWLSLAVKAKNFTNVNANSSAVFVLKGSHLANAVNNFTSVIYSSPYLQSNLNRSTSFIKCAGKIVCYIDTLITLYFFRGMYYKNFTAVINTVKL